MKEKMSLAREAAAAAALALLLPGVALAQQQQPQTPTPPPANPATPATPTTPPATTPPATTPDAGTGQAAGGTTPPIPPATPPTTTALPDLGTDQGTPTPQPSAKTPPTPLPKKTPDTSVTGVKPGAETKPTTVFTKPGEISGQPLPGDPQTINTLQDALSISFARNPTILLAQERAVKTNAQVNQILAVRLPTISASGTYSRLANTSSSALTAGGVTPSSISNPFGVGLTATPPGSSPIQLSTTTGTSGGAGSTVSTTSTSSTVTGSTSATTGGTTTASSTTGRAVEVSASPASPSQTVVSSGNTETITRTEQLTRQTTGTGGTGTTTTSDQRSFAPDLDQVSARVTVSQLIDITGVVRTAIQVGDLEKALSRLELARVRQQAVLDVTNAYYSVLKAQAFVQVNEAAVADSQELLRVTQAQLKAGVASQFDVLRAQTQLDNNQQALISSRNQVAISKNSLANQLGIDPSTVVNPQPVNVPPIPQMDEEALIQKAFQQRPEYLEADVNVIVAQKNIRLAHRTLEPYLNVGVSGAYNATSSGVSGDRATGSVGVTLSVPLYDGGATRAQVDAARSDARGAQIQRDQFIRGIKAEIQQAIIAVRDANDRSTSIASTVTEAREALRLANVRFRAGVGTQLDVNDSEAALVQAETNQVNALYDYLSALARLSRAVGDPA